MTLRFLRDWIMRTLTGSIITSSQEQTNEEFDSEEDGLASEAQAPLIKFARFVNGTLELFESRPDELKYVAFSHVWGDWKWRKTV